MEDCARILKRQVKIISIVLAVSLLVNLILAVMLCARLTHKAADVKQQTTATASADVDSYDIYTIVATGRRSAWDQTILIPNTACRKCKNSSLRNLSDGFCFPTRKKKYLPIYMYRNYPCGRWETVTGILRAASEKFILGC